MAKNNKAKELNNLKKNLKFQEIDLNNPEVQEKLKVIKNSLKINKQRSCRYIPDPRSSRK